MGRKRILHLLLCGQRSCSGVAYVPPGCRCIGSYGGAAGRVFDPRGLLVRALCVVSELNRPQLSLRVLRPPFAVGRWLPGVKDFSSTRGVSDFGVASGGALDLPRAKPIKKLLIANRGEIACRVIKTCKRMGVKTVAVYSEQDRLAMHVREADEAVFIGPATAAASYLNGSAILAAVKLTGAQAVHPGYGFLSENMQFAEKCKEQGISFLGPPSSAINDMGDKSVSKRLMIAAGVPVVPGYHGDDQTTEVLKREADRIGYPVLIKATQGGGGKGMRIVHNPNQFLESLAGAQREAKSAFGNDQVLIEKYLSQPRHIEVQIFGDKHGNVVHLFERDCSVQRRHQKIIEESPAPHITEDFRNRIGQAAVDAAKAVGYESAGTVEFIVDTLTGEFYFMEMNTRLQVEHPVTEMVTGQDLVEWQIRVANGEPLPLQQHEIGLSGHAFEARIYAENVPKGFLPASGTLRHFQPPSTSKTVRVETGVSCGDIVSVFYDPMIAKLVAWGHNRQAALTKLHSALSDFQIAGLPNNIDFLKALASNLAFEAGEVETHFIERHKSELLPSQPELSGADLKEATLRRPGVKVGAAVAAAAICAGDNETSLKASKHQGRGSVWNHPSLNGFRLNHTLSQIVQLDWKHEAAHNFVIPFNVKVTHKRDLTFAVQVEAEQSLQISIISRKDVGNGGQDLVVNVDGVSSSATLAHYNEGAMNHVHLWAGDEHHQFSLPVNMFGVREVLGEESSKRQATTGSQVPGAVTSPMSGRIVKVYVVSGAAVQIDDPLLVLEAMKMEHVVRAPISGVIQGAIGAVGDQVSDGSVLLQISERDDK